jgi:hypothetical protein
MLKEEQSTPGMEGISQYAGQPTRNVAWLATLARQAYEQNRTENCLALTKAILFIDPNNKEALTIQSLIQSASQSVMSVVPPSPSTFSDSHLDEESLMFSASPVSNSDESVQRHSRSKGFRLRSMALTAAAVAVAFLGTSWLTHPRSTQSNSGSAVASTQEAPQARPAVVQRPNDAVIVPQPALTPQPVMQNTSATSASAPAVTPAAAAAPAPTTAPPATDAKPAVPAAMGTLNITSSVPAEIYERGKRIGSTPSRLVLAAGAHELEYRFEDFRKTASYIIRTNETTATGVSFDVKVHINAKPWAQVFLGESQKTLLGQTPLSNVQVAIGSILVFENPNFPAKTYRVTGKETAILVNFP